MYSLLKSLFFTKSYLAISSYFFLCWVIHLLFISIAAFFHFLLKHPLSVIEEWTHHHGWELLICSKAIAFFIVSRFQVLDFETKRPLKSILKNIIKVPSGEILILSIYILISLLFIGLPKEQYNNDIFSASTFWSYFGSFMMIFFDLMIIYLSYREDRMNHYLLNIFCVSLTIYVWFKFTFLYAQNVDFSFLFHLILINFIFFKKHMNFSNIILYLLLVFSLTSAVFGEDLFWGSSYSSFTLRKNPVFLERVSIYVIALVYLQYHKMISVFKKMMNA